MSNSVTGISISPLRLSQDARNKLIRLKMLTGIRHWNALCRWALCVSLADPYPPLVRSVVTDSNVEMDWKTFGGPYGDIYLAMLLLRCHHDGVIATSDAVHDLLTIHVHRGIGFLTGMRLQDVTEMIALATQADPEGTS